MKQGKIALAATAVALVGAMLLGTTGATAAAPATQPTTKPAAGGRTAVKRRLPKPWSDLKSLTPQQQDQIYKIHTDANEQRKLVEQKEHDDVAAVLTPDQRKELADAEDKDKADRKEKLAETRRKRSDATTKPTK